MSSSTIDEVDLCTVCKRFRINSIFLDCGHMLTCYGCGKPMTKCPVCQKDLKGCMNMDDMNDDEPSISEDLKEYLPTVPWMNALMPVSRPSSSSQVQKPKEAIETLSDILSEDVIPKLTIRQLKSLLKGEVKNICEKEELIAEVKERWSDMNENAIDDRPAGQEEKSENLCCKCQKAKVDSMFSDCGHMVCCFNCGTTTDQCPICQTKNSQVVNMWDLYKDMRLEDLQEPLAQSENEDDDNDGDDDFTWEEGICQDCNKQGIDYIFPECGHMIICKKCMEQNNACTICPQIQIIK